MDMHKNNLIVAVLSGKGGTGKTFVAVNLAAVLRAATYIDCDVEEPNGHLFFKPKDVVIQQIDILNPIIDEKLCDGCQKCVQFCKFNALAYVQGHLMVFDDVCHSCGGCALLCPKHAITERKNNIGQIQNGKSENVEVRSGILNPGIASGVPVIRQLLNNKNKRENMTVIDCPPGSACIVMESIKDADYCILVAEPTIFGVHNLEMVLRLVHVFNKPHGVILNKCLNEENSAEMFCKKNHVTILGMIPFLHELGKLNSEGVIAVRVNQEYQKLFSEIFENVQKEVNK